MKRLGILVTSAALVLLMAPAALAADTPAMLSSWQPTFSDQEIVGGGQVMTVINHTADTMDHIVVQVGPGPCDCVIVSSNASHGSMSGDSWIIESLAAGEVATLTIDFAAPQIVSAEAPAIAGTYAISAFERALGLIPLGPFAIA